MDAPTTAGFCKLLASFNQTKDSVLTGGKFPANSKQILAGELYKQNTSTAYLPRLAPVCKLTSLFTRLIALASESKPANKAIDVGAFITLLEERRGVVRKTSKNHSRLTQCVSRVVQERLVVTRNETKKQRKETKRVAGAVREVRESTRIS